MIGEGFKTKEEMLHWRKENHGRDTRLISSYETITAVAHAVIVSTKIRRIDFS